MTKEINENINISREAFASYEEEITLLRESMERATDILNLYAKHMPIGFLRQMRDEINAERDFDILTSF